METARGLASAGGGDLRFRRSSRHLPHVLHPLSQQALSQQLGVQAIRRAKNRLRKPRRCFLHGSRRVVGQAGLHGSQHAGGHGSWQHTYRGFFTHTVYSWHTGTFLHTVVGHISVTADGTLTQTVHGTCLHTEYGTHFGTVHVRIVQTVVGTHLTWPCLTVFPGRVARSILHHLTPDGKKGCGSIPDWRIDSGTG
jgi:hypothetical protein